MRAIFVVWNVARQTGLYGEDCDRQAHAWDSWNKVFVDTQNDHRRSKTWNVLPETPWVCCLVSLLPLTGNHTGRMEIIYVWQIRDYIQTLPGWQHLSGSWIIRGDLPSCKGELCPKWRMQQTRKVQMVWPLPTEMGWRTDDLANPAQ